MVARPWTGAHLGFLQFAQIAIGRIEGIAISAAAEQIRQLKLGQTLQHAPAKLSTACTAELNGFPVFVDQGLKMP